MVRQLSQRNTITIPLKVLKKTGSKPGDFFEIANDGNRIILISKTIEDKFTESEWGKLAKIAEEKGKLYKNAEDAKTHLKDLINEL
jgi:bifunctional DNA-binding transcriptional regulator/antitoxin component of YhaV-PrlF toxin-antitoxin module